MRTKAGKYHTSPLDFVSCCQNPFIDVCQHWVSLQDSPVKLSQKAFFEHFKHSIGCTFPPCFFAEVFESGNIFINFVAPHFEFGEVSIGLFSRCSISKSCGECGFPFGPESFVHFQVDPVIHFGGCCNHLLSYLIVNARSFDVRESQGDTLVGVDHGLISAVANVP